LTKDSKTKIAADDATNEQFCSIKQFCTILFMCVEVIYIVHDHSKLLYVTLDALDILDAVTINVILDTLRTPSILEGQINNSINQTAVVSDISTSLSGAVSKTIFLAVLLDCKLCIMMRSSNNRISL
jgi:hypothetical protein